MNNTRFYHIVLSKDGDVKEQILSNDTKSLLSMECYAKAINGTYKIVNQYKTHITKMMNKKKQQPIIINGKKVNSFEVTTYEFKMIDNEPKIVISAVKALDENGGYIKFAGLKGVEKYLSSYPTTFKEKEYDE